MAQSAEGGSAEYTDCFSAEGKDSPTTTNECSVPQSAEGGSADILSASLQRGKTPPMSVLIITLNNLIVKCGSFGKC